MPDGFFLTGNVQRGTKRFGFAICLKTAYNLAVDNWIVENIQEEI